MAQTDNPFLDGLAKAFTDAAGAAQSVRAEIDTFVSSGWSGWSPTWISCRARNSRRSRRWPPRPRTRTRRLAARIAALEAKSST